MKKIYTIGIAGTSASGKSTLAYALQKRLECCKVKVIHMDEYYRPREERPVIKGIYNGKEYVDDNHPGALYMDRIRSDFHAARAAKWDVVILEGLFALYDEEIFSQLDLKIYVECDQDERLVRRIKRHLAFGQEFGEITERYVQAVQPRQRELVEPTKWKAQLLVNGMQDGEKNAELVLALAYGLD